jgi:lipocalin
MFFLRGLTVLAAINAVRSSACPDITSLRSSNITSNFSPEMLEGVWYELAYQDPAQIGSTCPSLNATVDAKTGIMTAPFSVKYGPIPFTIVEEYSPTSEVGIYGKVALPPTGPRVQQHPLSAAKATLTLPTVFVDVTTASSSSTHYDTMTLYSCLEVDGAAVTELVFASRSQTSDPDTLASMEAIARAQGVQWDNETLVQTNYDGCS